MRPSREACLADVGNRAADANARADVDAAGKTTQMPITTDKPVAVTDVDQVAVSAFPSCENHNPVTNRANRRAHRCRVIRSLVLAPDSEDRMLPSTEDARDSPEGDRSAQERSTQ